MSFNEQLKKLREERNLSQSDFAKDIGLTRSAISMYELGKREPNLETLKKFADFFNVSIDELIDKNKENKVQKKKYIALHRLVDELHPGDIQEVIDFAKLKKCKRNNIKIWNDDDDF